MMPVLYIIIPCYNEEDVLPVTSTIFLNKLKSLIAEGSIDNNSRIMFIDDGSKDNTWNIILDLSKEDSHYIGIRQSRNRGHQNALLAGLMEAKDRCDITISIDCDGQDDINAMDAMVAEYAKGCEIVYGIRQKRDTDTFFKRFTAESFYKIANWLGENLIFNHADYRLVSSKVLQEFSNFTEVNLFLRGLFPLVGFKNANVYYERNERIAGKGHYTFKKMLVLAVDGITSFSIRPVRLITLVGLFTIIISFIGIIWAIIAAIAGKSIAGWSSIVCIICFMSGMQLFSLGIIGEYIGKIYMEAKHRPRYIISERTYDEERQDQ